MWHFITTQGQQVSAIAAAVSAILAFVALIYNGRQLKKNALNTRRQMYLDALGRYMDLRKLIVNDPSLGEIYKVGFDTAKLTDKQRFYIHLLIAFCEGLYLTNQIDAFKEINGGTWENFIRHTFSQPAVRAVWDPETKVPNRSDYAADFIAYANRLGQEDCSLLTP